MTHDILQFIKWSQKTSVYYLEQGFQKFFAHDPL